MAPGFQIIYNRIADCLQQVSRMIDALSEVIYLYTSTHSTASVFSSGQCLLLFVHTQKLQCLMLLTENCDEFTASLATKPVHH